MRFAPDRFERWLVEPSITARLAVGEDKGWRIVMKCGCGVFLGGSVESGNVGRTIFKA